MVIYHQSGEFGAQIENYVVAVFQRRGGGSELKTKKKTDWKRYRMSVIISLRKNRIAHNIYKKTVIRTPQGWSYQW